MVYFFQLKALPAILYAPIAILHSVITLVIADAASQTVHKGTLCSILSAILLPVWRDAQFSSASMHNFPGLN